MQIPSFYHSIRANALAFMITGLALCLTIGGCSSNKSREIDVRGRIHATETLNPDVNGESRPVNLLVFYMSDPKAFEEATFLDLYRNAGDILGEGMLKMNRYQILPGQEKAFEDRAPESTTAVGVVAAFRDIDQSQWKAVVATPEKCYLTCPNSLYKDAILIDITRLTVTVKLGD